MSDKQHTPLVSVLLPFVDEGDWLMEAVHSIVHQSFYDLELILIENGEDPATSAIARQAASLDDRIRLIQESKKGIAFALNAGIRAAAGRYIARMDADDIAHKDRIGDSIAMLEADPRLGVAAVGCELFPITENNQGFARFVDWQNNLRTAEEHALARFIDVPVAHPAVVMRASLFNSLGNYSEDPLPEDYELWLRWMRQGVRFGKSSGKLLKWRDHGNRLTRSSENYSEEAFSEIRMRYLADWIHENIDVSRPVIVCGSSGNIRTKITKLEKNGIHVHAVTDVKQHSGNQKAFIPIDGLHEYPRAFIVNLIARTDLRESISNFLTSLDRKEGVDFIMAG